VQGISGIYLSKRIVSDRSISQIRHKTCRPKFKGYRFIIREKTEHDV